MRFHNLQSHEAFVLLRKHSDSSPNISWFFLSQLQNQEKSFELYGFPKVLVCIDGTHVPILAPPSDEDLFVNMKNFHSINIVAICDSDLQIIMLHSRCFYLETVWHQSTDR